MKKIKCLVSVPDKYTGRQYKEGETYEFEDARADEILACRTRVTGEPFFEEFEEVSEEVVQAVAQGIVETAQEEGKTVEETVNEIIEEGKEAGVIVENVENPVENTVENVETPEGQEGTDLKVGEGKEVVLEDMKVAELKDLASKMNIEGFDKMKKEELIEAIKNHG